MGNCGSSPGTRERSPTNTGRRQVAMDPAEAAIGDGKPLSREERWTSSPPVGRTEIDRKRQEFWDTAPAYEGSREIWDALKAACEAEDTGMAQAILSASEIKLPNGSLTNCFDTTGSKYNVPRFCISYPDNMVAGGAVAAAQVQAPVAAAPAPAPAASPPMSPTSPTSPMLQPSSTPASPASPGEGEGMKIKCRLSIGQDETSIFGMHDTAMSVKERVFESRKIEMYRMRVYFVGKAVPDRMPLASLGLGKNDVLQVMVLPASK